MSYCQAQSNNVLLEKNQRPPDQRDSVQNPPQNKTRNLAIHVELQQTVTANIYSIISAMLKKN